MRGRRGAAVLVDIPVERNVSERTGIMTADVVGLSAEPNTGELPLADLDPGPNSTLSGPTSASFYYPRLGAFGTDATSSRNPKGIPGVEVLMQTTWVPGPGGVNPPPSPGQAPGAAAPALASGALRAAAGRALVDLVCGGDAVCSGTLRLLSRGPRAAQRRAGAYGRADYAIPARARKRIRIPLNASGRRLLRERRVLRLTLEIAPSGGAPSVTQPVTLRARKR